MGQILKSVFYAVMRSPHDKWAVQVEALKVAVGSHIFKRSCSREAYWIRLWQTFST